MVTTWGLAATLRGSLPCQGQLWRINRPSKWLGHVWSLEACACPALLPCSLTHRPWAASPSRHTVTPTHAQIQINMQYLLTFYSRAGRFHEESGSALIRKRPNSETVTISFFYFTERSIYNVYWTITTCCGKCNRTTSPVFLSGVQRRWGGGGGSQVRMDEIESHNGAAEWTLGWNSWWYSV